MHLNPTHWTFKMYKEWTDPLTHPFGTGIQSSSWTDGLLWKSRQRGPSSHTSAFWEPISWEETILCDTITPPPHPHLNTSSFNVLIQWQTWYLFQFSYVIKVALWWWTLHEEWSTFEHDNDGNKDLLKMGAKYCCLSLYTLFVSELIH